MWSYRKLAGEIIDITPNLTYGEGLDSRIKRGVEIDKWLTDNKLKYDIESYVILDDDTDMLPHQMNYFVQCSENKDHEDCIDIGYGLTRRCAEMAINILNI